MKTLVPIGLLILYIIVFIVCAISPYDRAVWWAENIPIMLIVAAIITVSKYYRFSPLSYLLMACLIILHTIGGHYTFERVPFDFVTKLFGFTRNHYDRLAHFTVGFYAYPIAEILLAKKLVRAKWILALFPIFAMFAVAAGYEIFEWIYAVSADPTAGIAVLGSQGDVWDAQKDMLSDVLGSIFATMLFWLVFNRQIRQTNQQN
jgi:putative membrane protein